MCLDIDNDKHIRSYSRTAAEHANWSKNTPKRTKKYHIFFIHDQNSTTTTQAMAWNCWTRTAKTKPAENKSSSHQKRLSKTARHAKLRNAQHQPPISLPSRLKNTSKKNKTTRQHDRIQSRSQRPTNTNPEIVEVSKFYRTDEGYKARTIPRQRRDKTSR